jgi:hypothetical protein
MRTRRAVTALAGTALAAAAITGPAAAAASAARACTPGWKLVATPPPPIPPTFPGNAYLSGATVVSSKDAWFPEWAAGVQGKTPWALHWDGRALSAAPAIPQDPFIFRDAGFGGSFDSATDGWVLGDYQALSSGGTEYAAHWSGGRWTITPLAVSPDPTSEDPLLVSVASISPSDAWAVGEFDLGFAVVGALIEHWDGSQWRVVPNPLSHRPHALLNNVTVVSPTDIWAVGQQFNGSSVVVPLAEHWNGHAWTVVPVPAGAAPSSLLAVSARGPGDIWAVGEQTEPGTGGLATGLVEHWDGTSWRAVTGLPHLGNSELTAVYAASPADVWATVLAPRPDTDLGVDNFLHWDGSHWTLVPVPGPHEFNTDYEYAGLAGSGPGDVWAVGYIHHRVAVPDQPLLAHLSCG